MTDALPMSVTPAVGAVCDFSRCYVRWRTDKTRRPMQTSSHPPVSTLNNVRIPLECLATVTWGDRTVEFGLSASCKTERVFVDRDVWTEPNADMCAITGGGEFLVVKRWDRVNKGIMLSPPSLGVQPERHAVDPAMAFETHSLDLRRRGARVLTSFDAILHALNGDRPVVGQTTYAVDGGKIRLEYPVKTINFSERHRYYQVDTGPVIFVADPTGPHLIERCHLAYVAHLGGDWAEFLVLRPIAIEGTSVSVHHFSESRRVAAVHALWVFED